MKTTMPHRYLRRSRVKRLKGAGWCEFWDSNSWTHSRYPNSLFTMGEALTYQAALEVQEETGEPLTLETALEAERRAWGA